MSFAGVNGKSTRYASAPAQECDRKAEAKIRLEQRAGMDEDHQIAKPAFRLKFVSRGRINTLSSFFNPSDENLLCEISEWTGS
jgi:hypothetical protein